MKKLCFVVVFVMLLIAPLYVHAGGVGIGQSQEQDQSQAQGQLQVQGQRQSQDQTAVGIGVGIGISKNTNVNANSNHNTNANLNMNSSASFNAGNEQATSVVIENSRQHTSVVGPYEGADLMEPGTMEDFHNDVWLPEGDITLAMAQSLEPLEGYLWGTKTTVKVLNSGDKISSHITKGVGIELVAIVTFRGNYGTKGYECQGRVARIAMELGGTHYQTLAKGVELASKSWRVGVGSSGQVSGLHGKTASTQVGGSGGSGTNYGTAKIKARPFITIAIYR